MQGNTWRDRLVDIRDKERSVAPKYTLSGRG